jgi:hypothetical protein
MCKCTPHKRTPFCGAPGCEWPKSEAHDADSIEAAKFYFDSSVIGAFFSLDQSNGDG